MQDGHDKSFPNAVDVHVGRKIAQYRKSAGLTIEQLANRLNVPAEEWIAFETGQTRINVGTLSALSVVLQLPMRVFFEELE